MLINSISQLDTQRFGFKIAKLNDFSENIESDLFELKKLGVKLIISRVNSNNIQLINKLEDYNFRIKDTQLTFVHDINNINAYVTELSIRKDVVIEVANKEDADTIGKIALESFKGYGHYAENDQLDKNKANEIYEDWAQKSCLDKNIADYMFIAKINNQIGGFLSLKTIKGEEGIFGIHGIGAVNKDFRNMDIFKLLIMKCLIAGKSNKHMFQRTFFLSSNIPVIRSYLKIGFKISESNHTMHCWL